MGAAHSADAALVEHGSAGSIHEAALPPWIEQQTRYIYADAPLYDVEDARLVFPIEAHPTLDGKTGLRFEYIHDLEERRGTWIEEDTPPPVPATGMLSLLSSQGLVGSPESLRRENGRRIVDQPYGAKRLEFVLDEERTWSEWTYSTGLIPVFGRWRLETRGKGELRLRLADDSRSEDLVSIPYDGGMVPHFAYWSHDGRYIVAWRSDGPLSRRRDGGRTLSFAVFGPYESSLKTPQQAQRALAAEQAEIRHRILRRRFERGEITAASFFGPTYERAEAQIANCAALQKILGDIRAIELAPDARSYELSDEGQTVGRFFFFSVATGSGPAEVGWASFHADAELESVRRVASRIAPITVNVSGSMHYLRSCGGS